ADVLKVVLPPESVPVPSVVVPSMKVTLPVGVPLPEPAALTVAVKVTFWPKAEGLTPDVTVVVLLGVPTVCIRALDVLVGKLVSPTYMAEMVWTPCVKADVAKRAWLLEFKATVANTVF